MKVKMIIERILKVINIMMNIIMTLIAFASYCHYGTNGYMMTDDIYRILWIVVMLGTINIGDNLIRKTIREF